MVRVSARFAGVMGFDSHLRQCAVHPRSLYLVIRMFGSVEQFV